MDIRTDIIATLNQLFWATDHHDWELLKKVFSKQITLNYGQPTQLDPDGVIAMWQPVFQALDAHQHLVSNHLVTLAEPATTAMVVATFIATHQFGEQTWTLGGDYEFELIHHNDSWEVTAMTMRPVWQTGPTDLVQQALAQN